MSRQVGLAAIDGDDVRLQGVTARGRLQGLLFELEVEQNYRNDSDDNIEAAYTFAVPSGAVLLGLELTIGDRQLAAVIVRREQGRVDYEKAIDEGNTAVLLEQTGDGLFTASLGNLQAGEQALIRYRYAELLDRHGDTVRVTIPTVIAPRYGDPLAAGLAHHQVPVTDLAATYPFSLELTISGVMARAVIASPSHPISLKPATDCCRVGLARQAWLDRDFVLTLSGPVTRSATLVAPDGDGYVALVSLDPGLTGEPATPIALKLLVDCSGSMGGDSIAAARRALAGCLARLGPADRVSLNRFGSSLECVTEGLLPASGPNLARLDHAVRHLQADLGGTELAAAIGETLAIPRGDGPAPDLLVITDAEVWGVESVLATAAASGQRLFVVAVGAAPAEVLARQLASRTGGACEFVAPGEDAAPAISRMFRRLRETPKQVARVRWPAAPLWEAPLPVAVFSGDTLHLLAGFSTPPAGEVTVELTDAPAGAVSLAATFGRPVTDPVLPRLAAARRLTGMAAAEAAALAEQYQLISPWTSGVVVDQRAEKDRATTLPELRRVGHMLAAGWGGVGSVESGAIGDACLSEMSAGMAYCRRPSMGFEVESRGFQAESRVSGAEARQSVRRNRSARRPQDSETYLLASGTFAGDAARDRLNVRVLRDKVLPFLPGAPAPGDILRALLAARQAGQPLPATLAELRVLGVPEAVLDILTRIIAHHASEAEAEVRVVQGWIALLAASPAGGDLTADQVQTLTGAVAGQRSSRMLRAELRTLLARVSDSHWLSPRAPETVR